MSAFREPLVQDVVAIDRKAFCARPARGTLPGVPNSFCAKRGRCLAVARAPTPGYVRQLVPCTDRSRVAHALSLPLAPGGGSVALASSSVWEGEQSWKVTLLDTINAWTGQGQRARSGRLPGAPLHQDVLRETPFGEPRVVDIVKRHTWTTDTLIGLLYSSSLQLPRVLGDRIGSSA